MNTGNFSQRIVKQRIRSRLIELLGSFVAFSQEQGTTDLNELLNEWEDWVGIEHPIQQKDFDGPVYTAVEYEVLLSVDKAWERFCKVTPQTITDTKAALQLPSGRHSSRLRQMQQQHSTRGTNVGRDKI